MRVRATSILTGREHVMDLPGVTFHDLERIEAGEAPHVVVPHLSRDQLEFLVNGITPDEERELLPAEDVEAWGC